MDFPIHIDTISKDFSKLYLKGPQVVTFSILIYRSTSLSQSPREWRKYFELSEVGHKQNVMSTKYVVHVQFLQDILLQYICSKTVILKTR